MRQVVFTNSLGNSITIGTNNYPILSIEGLGIPSIENQTQRAPYQDGSTWIDTLLSDREILVYGAINYPKDLTALYTARSTMASILNPKLGQGTLIYTDDSGSRKIECIPNITFANKDSSDPFLRFELMFTCHDPYFTSVTENTENIIGPSATLIGQVSNANFDGVSPCIFYISATDYLVFYIRATDGFVVYKRFDGSVFGSETVAVGLSVKRFSLCQYAGTPEPAIRLFYIKTSDEYIYEIGNNVPSLDTWSASTLLISKQCNDIAANYTQNPTATNDKMHIFYIIKSGSYLAHIEWNNPSWSSEEILTDYAADSPSCISDANNQWSNTESIVIFRKTFASEMIMMRAYDGTTVKWGVERLVPYSVSSNIQSIRLSNNNIFINYLNLLGDRVFIEYNETLDKWSPEMGSVGGVLDRPAIYQVSDDYFIVARSQGATDFSVVSYTRNKYLIENSSDSKTPFNAVVIYSNPILFNYDTFEYIKIDWVGSSLSYVEINTELGKKTIDIVYINSVSENGFSLLDGSSTMFNLKMGDNNIMLGSSTVEIATGGGGTATITWSERFINS